MNREMLKTLAYIAIQKGRHLANHDPKQYQKFIETEFEDWLDRLIKFVRDEEEASKNNLFRLFEDRERRYASSSPAKT